MDGCWLQDLTRTPKSIISSPTPEERKSVPLCLTAIDGLRFDLPKRKTTEFMPRVVFYVKACLLEQVYYSEKQVQRLLSNIRLKSMPIWIFLVHRPRRKAIN